MVVDLSKPEYEAEMTGREMKVIRVKLGLSALELGRAFGYTGSDSNAQHAIHRFETESKHGREIPPWLARLARMYERYGVPPEFLEVKQRKPKTEGPTDDE